jgi:hypothetical protein
VTGDIQRGCPKTIVRWTPSPGLPACSENFKSKAFISRRIGKTECVEEQNQVAVRFNEKLKSVLASLMHSVLDLKLVYVDIYEVLSDIVYNPGKFGNFF